MSGGGGVRTIPDQAGAGPPGAPTPPPGAPRPAPVPARPAGLEEMQAPRSGWYDREAVSESGRDTDIDTSRPRSRSPDWRGGAGPGEGQRREQGHHADRIREDSPWGAGS